MTIPSTTPGALGSVPAKITTTPAANGAGTRFGRDVQRRRDEIVDRAHRSDTAEELFEAVSGRVGRLAPFDSLLWTPSDPDKLAVYPLAMSAFLLILLAEM